MGDFPNLVLAGAPLVLAGLAIFVLAGQDENREAGRYDVTSRVRTSRLRYGIPIP